MPDPDLREQQDSMEHEFGVGTDDFSGDAAGSVEEPATSLADDIGALFDDSKTYVEAELRFQKTRLSFAANRGKSGIVYLLAALGLLHLALVGLVIGGIISLAPHIGPFGATLAVAGVLLLLMVIFLMLAKGKFSGLSEAFRDENR